MSLQLVLRVVSARGDKPIRYDATDKAKIKEIIDTVIIPNLEKGWTLFGAKKDEKEPYKIADQYDAINPKKLEAKLVELDRFMLEDGHKVLVAPVMGG